MFTLACVPPGRLVIQYFHGIYLNWSEQLSIIIGVLLHAPATTHIVVEAPQRVDEQTSVHEARLNYHLALHLKRYPILAPRVAEGK